MASSRTRFTFPLFSLVFGGVASSQTIQEGVLKCHFAGVMSGKNTYDSHIQKKKTHAFENKSLLLAELYLNETCVHILEAYLQKLHKA